MFLKEFSIVFIAQGSKKDDIAKKVGSDFIVPYKGAVENIFSYAYLDDI